MAIFKWLQRLLWACRTNVLTPDPVLDNLIREALVEQALHSAIPVTTWDRVRRSLLERRLAHRSGMWVLDEPLREPPEAAWRPAAPSLWEVRRESQRTRMRELAWAALMPPYTVLLNV